MNLTSKIHQTRRVMSSALPSSELILLLTIASIVTLPSLQVIFMICLLYCCFQCVVIIVVLGVSVYKIPLKLYAPTHHCSSLDSVNPASMFLPLLSRHVDQFMERDNAIHFHFRHWWKLNASTIVTRPVISQPVLFIATTSTTQCIWQR